MIQHDHLLHCEFNPCQIRDGVNQAYLTMFCTAAVHAVQARKNLQLVRGTKDVDREFNDLVEFAKLAAECKHPWRTLFSKKYRPQLILSACSTGFQQWTGYVFLYCLSLFSLPLLSWSVSLFPSFSPFILCLVFSSCIFFTPLSLFVTCSTASSC